MSHVNWNCVEDFYGGRDWNNDFSSFFFFRVHPPASSLRNESCIRGLVLVVVIMTQQERTSIDLTVKAIYHYKQIKLITTNTRTSNLTWFGKMYIRLRGGEEKILLKTENKIIRVTRIFRTILNGGKLDLILTCSWLAFKGHPEEIL